MPIKKTTSRPRTSVSVLELEEEIQRLRNELFLARQDLIHLADYEGYTALAGYYADDLGELERWRQEAADRLLSVADGRPGFEISDPRGGPRALCPLCRRGAEGSRDVEGYSLPVGLRRHLLGEMNSRQCPIFGAAEKMSRESISESRWRPKLKKIRGDGA